MIKHNLEREKSEDYELMQKISEDKGKQSNNTIDHFITNTSECSSGNRLRISYIICILYYLVYCYN